MLCETFTDAKKATATNKRQACIEIINRVCDHEVNIGFGQEFYLLGPADRPFGWPCGALPLVQGKNYGGIGTHRVVGREIIECIERSCLYAGINVYGTSPERTLGQWKFLTGPSLSIQAADELWVARYIMQRIAEDYGLSITFRTCPVLYRGLSALHTSFSTKKSRENGGYQVLMDYIKKLANKHAQDVKILDMDGVRLSGDDQTCQREHFRHGVGDRTACIKITPAVVDKKKGYFQDRRPCACSDPYVVITTLIKSCLL